MSTSEKTIKEMDNTSIKDNIRKIRKRHCLTQEEMAHRLGISLTAYRDLETGKTSVVSGHLKRIAELLDTSTEEIVLGYMPVRIPADRLNDMKEEYSSHISELEKEIEYLKKLVRNLEDTIQTKNQIIEMLQK